MTFQTICRPSHECAKWIESPLSKEGFEILFFLPVYVIQGIR